MPAGRALITVHSMTQPAGTYRPSLLRRLPFFVLPLVIAVFQLMGTRCAAINLRTLLKQLEKVRQGIGPEQWLDLPC